MLQRLNAINKNINNIQQNQQGLQNQVLMEGNTLNSMSRSARCS